MNKASMIFPDALMVILYVLGIVMLFVAPVWAPLCWAVPAGWAAGDAVANIVNEL